VGGVATGAGFGPLNLDYVLGIVKAYTTRVGSGPFPTELDCAVGQHLGVKGHEFGDTTGRKRRTGWFDAVAIKRAVQINSITGFCLTKLDVLDGLESLSICVGYKDQQGNIQDVPPMAAEGYELITPVYESMPGWSENSFAVTDYAALPQGAKNYIQRLEQLTGVPIDIISTGPERNETIVLRHPFEV
jgi:adenylosuccinate synthase